MSQCKKSRLKIKKDMSNSMNSIYDKCKNKNNKENK